MIDRLIRNRLTNVSPVEALYSRLFVDRPLCKVSPRLVCSTAATRMADGGADAFALAEIFG